MSEASAGQIYLMSQASSTNELALAAIDEGAPQGTAFVADSQTAGRGRRESGGRRRQWFSPPGKNLYLSVIVRPVLALEKSAAITLACGAALVGLLRDTTGVDVELKWPNDLYVHGKKLGGILTEGVTGAAGLDAMAIGVGLNIQVTADEFPPELTATATSLFEESRRHHDRMSLALQICEAIVQASDRYADEGLAGFMERLRQWDYLRGHKLRIESESGHRDGIGRGISAQGGLKVEFEDGHLQEVVSGEVSICPRPNHGSE